MENMNISAVNTANEPKHKWLAKGSKIAKKAVLSLTTLCSMAAMCGTTAFAATGEVDTSSFISTACTVLKSVICLYWCRCRRVGRCQPPRRLRKR